MNGGSGVPKRVVRQPNNRFAIFSTVVDDFTYMDLSLGEVVDEFCMELGEIEALRKAMRALWEEDPYTGERRDLQSRWKECLETIEMQYGKKRVRERLAEIGVKE
jgi:hypothetical protein